MKSTTHPHDPSPTSASSRDRDWLFLLPAALLLALHAYFYRGFTSDDAFISLRYAVRLATGGGLTWNDGEYVEGYSNLLWVILAAIGAFAGATAHLWIKVCGYICVLGA